MQGCNGYSGEIAPVGTASTDASLVYAAHEAAPGSWAAFQHQWDFFTNYGHYMPRIHCLQNEAGEADWPWIITLLVLTASIVVGYLKIFVFWRRSYLEVPPADRNRKLMQLAYVFLWCATCGYALSMLMFVWPAYRLLAGALLVLNVFTWRFASSLSEFKVSFAARRLERQLEEALQRRTQELERQVNERTAQLREARAAAEAANVAKSNFLANMSHEIRTPMTAILGFAELLSEPDVNDEQKRGYSKTIQDNGQHLLAIINDILDFSKIEAGKLQVETIACDPTELVTSVRDLMLRRAHDKGLHLRLHMRRALPAHIHTDPTRLRQVLTNLVANAIKFTPSGSVGIEASFQAESETHGTLYLHVFDTGIGMSDEQMGRLFTPFTQADTSTTRRFGGTGLGLSISKHLVELLGGQLTVSSAPDAGSTFVVMLNNVRFDRAEATNFFPEVNDEAAPNQPLNISILLAEDGVDNQRLFAHHLRSAGASLTIVDNGRAAVDLALSEGANFDLVLMDMQMPVLDGYSAVQELRRAGYGVPILALTAHSMAGDRERCLEAGCSGYISKPVTRASLIDACRDAVRVASRAAA
ncbi:MAG: ATP-binding protein [Planctomycetota bacterium]|nr:ATP-binding protein [Planctomycetota bacterium]